MTPEYMIEARHRAPAEWEPVSLRLGPDRLYHYSTIESAAQDLDAFLATESGLPQLIVRLASGSQKISELLEFRIVEVRSTEPDRLVVRTTGNVGIGQNPLKAGGPGGG